MILSGTSQKQGLFDLIKPLLARKKSGLILVKGDEVGEVYIEGGSIIHAKIGLVTGEDAILAMMEWDSGRVTVRLAGYNRRTDGFYAYRTITHDLD